MIFVGLSGAMGRMGKLILKEVLKQSDMAIVSAFEKKGHPLIGEDIGESIGIEPWKIYLTDDLEEAIQRVQVWVEFSSPDAVMEHLPVLKEKGIKVVIGTTGFSKDDIKKIEEYSKDIPILLSPNMSITVNLIFYVLDKISGLFKDYDIEIVENHHKKKKDAPSGTAKKMADIIADRLDRKWKTDLRENEEDNDIIVHSLRMANTVGEHSIYFRSDEEIFEISHKAVNREIFSKGTVECIRFIYEKENGLYSMSDIIKSLVEGG